MAAPLFIPFALAHFWLALTAADEQRGWAAMFHTALAGFGIFCIGLTGGAFA